MLDPKENSKRKHPISTDEDNVQNKRICKIDHAALLPDEMLLHIFSFLDVRDLYYSVRGVCKRWYRMSMLSTCWRNITVDSQVPTKVLQNWIQYSPIIRHIHMSNRNDVDIILEAMVKYSSRLKSISIERCRGSSNKTSILSNTMCKLLTKCKNLGTINLEYVEIRSCKFLKLLAERKNNGKTVHFRYIGPVTPEQLNAMNKFFSKNTHLILFD